jgi:hypothetical protein
MPDLRIDKRFEISFRRGERWQIDCLAFTDAEARTRADELYADETVDAVRIARGRFGGDGTSFETVIHEQIRQGKRKEPPVRIAASPSHDAWCKTLDELYGTASRRAIARLLRNFLDRHAITATELLHYHRYIRLLERQDNLLPQALQRIAGLQARARNADARVRLDVLNRFVDEATTRARDALESRAAPRIGEGGLAALNDAIAGLACRPEDQAFYMRFAVSCALETVGGAIEKFDQVTAWIDGVPDISVALIDELAAGLCGAAAVLQEALGPQSHLAAALGTMADLALGRADQKIAPKLAPLAPLLAAGRLPETRLVLLERVERELAGDKPLSRDDAPGQRRLFEALLDKLVDERGLYVGGATMVEAIARRSRGFDIIGGVEAVRFASPEPLARMDQLANLAAKALGERQQRAVATCLAELLDTFDGDRASLAPLRARIEPSRLGPQAKEAVLGRLP